ncbi:MAG: dihydropteroate synthase [Imperialibacter sp.]
MLSIHKPFDAKRSIEVRGQIISLEYPCVMGIVNFTPDSFYDGGRLKTDGDILALAERHLTDGATFLDIGGYSSRPDADHISEEEEQRRVGHVVATVIRQFPQTILSVDTFRASVAKAALDAGAQMINEISGGDLDAEMFSLVVERNVPYILMHMRGTPQTMKQMSDYEDVLQEVCDYFSSKLNYLRSNGVKDIIIDPGFGFAKGPSAGFELLGRMSFLEALGAPVMVGLSRKSMIYKTLEINAEEALNGTTALHMIALENGANILRVHDTKEAIEAIELYRRVYT